MKLADLLHDADEVYHLLASVDLSTETLSKPELVGIYTTDENMFDEIDADDSGDITCEEWCHWLEKHSASLDELEAGSGLSWLFNLLVEIRIACMSFMEVRKAENARLHREEEVKAVMVRCEETFVLLAAQVEDGEEPLVLKADFVKAHGGDFKVSDIWALCGSHK